MRNLLNLRQDLNANSHVFEEISMFKYLNVLTTRKNETSEELKMRIAASNHVIMVYNVLSCIEL